MLIDCNKLDDGIECQRFNYLFRVCVFQGVEFLCPWILRI